MSWQQAQSLLLRPTRARSVAHLLLRVAPPRSGEPQRSGEALKALKALLQEAPLTTGEQAPAHDIHCTLGFSYQGLEALGMPGDYLRIFTLLAPAFRQGAAARAGALGDTGTNAATRWSQEFAQHNAHVLLTLHGERAGLDALLARWMRSQLADAALVPVAALQGDRLGAPSAEHRGEWVHFGFRDGLMEHRIAGVGAKANSDTDVVEHAAGEFLLGYANDYGINRFGLPLAPEEVRAFFRDSSFGVLRQVEQHVHEFEQAVQAWQQQAQAVLGPEVGTDWVRAKLCGRWPSGEPIRPGQLKPAARDPEQGFRTDFSGDAQGLGCPWSAHVRRMDASGHADGTKRRRSLLRRGMPYGPANWSGAQDDHDRGLLALFFCANLEDQFELLVGQWANAAPPGRPASDGASDPLAGAGGEADAPVRIPLPGQQELRLAGLGAFSRVLGSVYTWHPGRSALARILDEEYAKKEDAPWL